MRKIYDHTEKVKGAIRNSVVEWAQDANVLPVIMAEAAPQVGHMNVTGNQLPELTVLWFIIQLMNAKPSLFPRSNP